MTPNIPPPILRRPRDTLPLIPIRPINIPNPITSSRIKLPRRALELQERGTSPIDGRARLKARKEEGVVHCLEGRVALRRLREEGRQHYLLTWTTTHARDGG